MDEFIITAYFYKLFPKEPFCLGWIKVEELLTKVPNYFLKNVKNVSHSLLIPD